MHILLYLHYKWTGFETGQKVIPSSPKQLDQTEKDRDTKERSENISHRESKDMDLNNVSSTVGT